MIVWWTGRETKRKYDTRGLKRGKRLKWITSGPSRQGWSPRDERRFLPFPVQYETLSLYFFSFTHSSSPLWEISNSSRSLPKVSKRDKNTENDDRIYLHTIAAVVIDVTGICLAVFFLNFMTTVPHLLCVCVCPLSLIYPFLWRRKKGEARSFYDLTYTIVRISSASFYVCVCKMYGGRWEGRDKRRRRRRRKSFAVIFIVFICLRPAPVC